ncbi:MAG: YqgE/AlgH family protein [Methyloligellaceae bacterium]
MRLPRSVIWVFVTVLLVLGYRPGFAADSDYLKGRLLVASAKMGDPRFYRSVIYLVDHDAKGAFGLIINKVYGRGSVANLMRGYDLDPKGAKGSINLHFGGPVRAKAAFILHSGDYAGPRSRKVDGSISFTFDIGILSEFATGKGPKRLLFALGYAGWASGQLERELERGDWTIAEATQDLIFGEHYDDLWDRLGGFAALPL